MTHTSLKKEITNHLDELIELVATLSDEQYTFIDEPNSASVGRHLRHTLEIFLLLVNNYEAGEINYEDRARDLTLEQDRAQAIHQLNFLKEQFDKVDKPLKLSSNQIVINTSYQRELLYQLEHIVHHNAIIRPTVARFSENNIRPNFGYAPATIKYQAKHVSG